MSSTKPPNEILRAFRILADLWKNYRHERVILHEKGLESVQFRKKFRLFSYRTSYATRSLLFLFMIPGQTFGMEQAKIVAKTYGKLVPNAESPADHIVVVRCKDSKAIPSVMDAAGFIWETISYEELRFNKMECGLVPLYRTVFDESEQKDLLRRLGMDHLMLLPKAIFRKDAIGRLLGWCVGDLIEITDKETLGISYRWVTS